MTKLEQAKREAVEQLKLLRRANIAQKAAEAAKQAVVTVPVSKKLAERIKAEPEGVALVHKSETAPTMFERPALGHVRVRVDLISEVDAQGRPIWDRPGVVSDYDPLSRVRMWGDRE